MKNPLRLAALTASAAILAVACSSGTTSNAPSSAPASESAAASSSSGASASASASASAGGLSGTLTIWDSYSSGGSAEGTALIQALAKARQAFPNLTINRVSVPFDQLFNKINTGWGAGEATPDMFIAPNDSLGDQTRLGILADLDTPLTGKLGDMSDIAVNGSKVDGKLMMVPESLKAVAMFYNTSIVATPPASLGDLLTLAKNGTKVGIAQYAGAYYNWGLYSAFGGKILDDTGKCVADQGGVADALQWMADMKATKNVTFYTDGGAFQKDFEDGKTGVVIEGPWATGDFKAKLADKLGIAPIPPGPVGKAQPMTGVDGWYINNAGANQDLAIQFALWMVGPDGEQIFADGAGHIPADTKVAVTDPVTKVFAQAVLDGYPRPQNKELGAYWSNFGDAQQKVLDAKATAKDAVAAACTAMNTANGK